MEFKIGDRVIIYGFHGKIIKIDNGNLLVKIDNKGGLMNCNYFYAKFE